MIEKGTRMSAFFYHGMGSRINGSSSAIYLWIDDREEVDTRGTRQDAPYRCIRPGNPPRLVTTFYNDLDPLVGTYPLGLDRITTR